MNTTQGTGNMETAKANSASSKAADAPSVTAEQEMLFKLKGTIDQNGRYSYKLGDMATGYAAGKGVEINAARLEIEDKFSRQFGQSPKEYLEKHYSERREMAQENGRSNGRGR